MQQLVDAVKNVSLLVTAGMVSLMKLKEFVETSMRERSRDQQAGDSIIRHFDCAWQEAESMAAALSIDLYQSLSASFKVDQLMRQLEQITKRLQRPKDTSIAEIEPESELDQTSSVPLKSNESQISIDERTASKDFFQSKENKLKVWQQIKIEGVYSRYYLIHFLSIAMGIVGGRVYIFNLLNCEMQKDTLIPDGKKFMINEVASGNKILLSLAGRFIQNGVPSIVEGVRNITRLIFEPVPLTKKLCKLETMDLLNSICDELDSDRGILLFIDAIFSHDANSDSIKRHIAPLDKDHGKDKVLLMGEVVKQTARDAISEKKVKKSLKKMMSRKLTSLIEYEDSPPLATLIPIISRSFDDLFTPELVSEFSCLKALSASMFVSQTLQS